MRIIFPAEGDFFSVKGNQPVIADRDAMCVTAQITQYGRWTGHRMFGIHNPMLAVQHSQESGKSLRLFERGGCSAEAQLVSAISALESIDELARKTRFRTPIGRKKLYRGCTQRV